MKRSYLEERFERVIRFHNMPEPIREFVFKSTSPDIKGRWRFDFAWKELKIAVEIDGGTYNNGGHVQGKRYEVDCKKNNAAQMDGWVVLRADRNMVNTEAFAKTVIRMIGLRAMWKRKNQLPY